jgi:hypothetical protein
MSREFMTHFVREHDGSWTCIEGCTIDGPNGRMQVCPGARFVPGEVFMGVDFARWLDD